MQELFGKIPSYKVDPEEAVATGAAIQGGLMKGVLRSAEDTHFDAERTEVDVLRDIIDTQTERIKVLNQLVDAISEIKDDIEERIVKDLETEVLSVQQKLNCFGVIERFEHKRGYLYRGLPRKQIWTRILNNDKDLFHSLIQLNGFKLPESTNGNMLNALVEQILNFHSKLTTEFYNDSPCKIECPISTDFCTQWETKFMIKICELINVKYRVVQGGTATLEHWKRLWEADEIYRQHQEE